MSFEVLTQEQINDLTEREHNISNAFIRGRFDYSACQLDILFALIASLKDETTLVYDISVKDIMTLTGNNWNYGRLTEATGNLLTRMFEIEDKNTYTQLVLFSEFKYKLGEGTIQITINDKAKELFFNLKRNFTPITLKNVLTCKSKYAKRLYMEICSWQNYKLIYNKDKEPMEIKELKYKLGLIEKKTGKQKYSQIGQFKEKVLDPAKKEINQLTDMTFDYELIKRGRSFNWVRFVFDRKESKQLSLFGVNDFSLSIEQQKFIKSIIAYGFSEIQATIIAKKVTLEEYKQANEKYQEHIKNTKKMPKNPLAYFITILKNEYALKLTAKELETLENYN